MIQKSLGVCLIALPFSIASLSESHAHAVTNGVELTNRSAANTQMNIQVAWRHLPSKKVVKFRTGKGSN